MANDEKSAFIGIIILFLFGLGARIVPGIGIEPIQLDGSSQEDSVARADTSALPLRPLGDAVASSVGTPPQGASVPSSGKSKKWKPGAAAISINKADQAQLQSLPGVGAAMASRILEYRRAHGAFRNAKDLGKVKGIGDAKLRKMLPAIVFD